MPVERPLTLLDRLRACDLLDGAQLDALAALPEAGNPDPRALGRLILQRRLATNYQLNLVAAGRAEELRVGPYLVLDKLGEGGMGRVLKARHAHMSRVVALKVIRKEKLRSPDAVQRFYQEVQAAAALSHPNIVLAFDAGPAGNTHYCAMEYVEGSDLAKRVKEKGPLPPALACECARQAALGLEHAHSRGLVHRDVKPHNLLLTQTPDGKPLVKILDMGLARLHGQADASLTQSGQLLGTPDYVAPEQALDSRKADARSDLYSLGCTLYFLLTGRPPFVAESLTQVLLMHQMEQVPRLKGRIADLPPGLEALVSTLMAKRPEDRYQTAAEAADALEPFARGEAEVPVIAPVEVELVPVAEDKGTDWVTLAGDDEPRSPSRSTSRTRAARRGEEEEVEEAPATRRARRRPPKKDATALLVVLGVCGAMALLACGGVGAFFLAGPAKKDRSVARDKPAPTPPLEVPAEEPTLPDKSPGELPESVLPPVLPAPPPSSPPPLPPEKAVPDPDFNPRDPIYAAVAAAVQAAKTTRTWRLGGGEVDFEDLLESGAVLVGLEVGVNASGPAVVQSVRPLYRSRRGKGEGQLQGQADGKRVTLEAKPGYALGAVNVRSGAGIDALSITFMKIDGDRLDPATAYESVWVGGPGGILGRVGGSGLPVVGLYGKLHFRGKALSGLGLITVAGKDQPPAPRLPFLPPDAPIFDGMEKVMKAGAVHNTKGVGGGAKAFEEVPGGGAVLVGLMVSADKSDGREMVRSILPLFRQRGVVRLCACRGLTPASFPVLEAKPGYAVGGLTVRADAKGIHGLSITFQAVEGERLNPDEAYQSEWVGGPGGTETVLGGDGTPVVGLFGKVGADGAAVEGLGLILGSKLETTAPDLEPLKMNAPILAAIEKAIRAGDTAKTECPGGGDKAFTDLDRSGALLVGIEVGVVPWGSQIIVQSVRPIYFTRTGRRRGTLRGKPNLKIVRLEAKPGYALGALTIKTGAGLDGMSATFMAVEGDGLNPAKAYVTRWAGGEGGNERLKLGGDGSPVVGIFGKYRSRDLVAGALGLVTVAVKKP